jgi:hypothetical protein
VKKIARYLAKKARVGGDNISPKSLLTFFGIIWRGLPQTAA